MSWRFLREELPTARKPHRCFLCGASIAIGERYVRCVGDRDGKLDAIVMHMDCERVTWDWDALDWDTFDELDFRGEMESRKTEQSNA